jgi:chromosomal replication initiation ATPase DnaA
MRRRQEGCVSARHPLEGARRPLPAAPQGSHWREIGRWIASVHGVTLEDLVGKSRSPKVAHARHHFVAVLRLREKRSLHFIARVIESHHTTVIYAVGAHLRRTGLDHERARRHAAKLEAQRRNHLKRREARR